jgi:hypothetical protein
LGYYTFSDKAKVKIISSGDGATIADAVKFVPVSEFIIDNGDVGTSSIGNWKVSSVAGFYGTESLYSNTGGDSYTFEASVMDTYEVSLWWTAHPGRSNNVSVEIYDGDEPIGTVIENQQVNGSQWNSLGYYTFSDKAKVKIISSGDGAVVADAVRFAP